MVDRESAEALLSRYGVYEYVDAVVFWRIYGVFEHLSIPLALWPSSQPSGVEWQAMIALSPDHQDW